MADLDDLTQFTFTGLESATVSDTSDGGSDLDVANVRVAVSITARPEVVNLQTSPPRTLRIRPVKLRIEDGVLVLPAGAVGDVRLVANAGLGITGQLLYDVKFGKGVIAGDEVDFSDQNFTFIAPNTDVSVDMTSVTRVSGSTPSGTVVPMIPDHVRLNGSGQLVWSSNGVDIPDPLTLNLDVSGAIASAVTAAMAALVAGAPGALDTLNELAAALGDDPNFATTIAAAIALKAPLASPTFTGTVAGITKSMVGLGNNDNTSDANKPVSTAQQTALDGKQALDADLTAIAALTSAANKVPYSTGAGAWALADFTAAGRALVDDADAAAQRNTLGVVARVSIVQFGATTGSADNHAAIVAAIAAVSAAGGGEVFVPAGVWITAPFSLPSRVTLVGEGATSSYLKLKNTSNAHFITLATANTLWVGLRDIGLDGNGANQSAGDVIHWDNTGFTGTGFVDGDAYHFATRVVVTGGKARGFVHDVTTGGRGALQLANVLAYSNGGDGFYINSPDNQFDHCMAAANGGNGFNLDTGTQQNRLLGCKSFFNGLTDGSGSGFQVLGSRNDLIHVEAQDNCNAGFVMVNTADCILIGKSERNGLGPSPYTAGGLGDGIFASGVTNCRIILNLTDRNSGGLKQRFGYSCGSGNNGNIVDLTIGAMQSTLPGTGSWGANSVVTIIYNSGTPSISAPAASFPTLNQSTTGNAATATAAGSATTAAACSGNAATATKLATARNINGVAFDGTANITVADATKAPLDATLNPQTGTTYTLVAGDDGKVVTLNNASAITVTVPQNSAAAIPIGAYIEFVQLGAGQVTFAAGTGATLDSRGTALKINAQYGTAALRKIATNEFVLAGDLTV